MLRRYRGRVEVLDLRRAASDPVDIALADPCTHDRGPDLCRLRADPRIRHVVVYTWNFQPWLARDLLDQGARGYLAKHLHASQLVAALEAVHAGSIVVAPAARTTPGRSWPGRSDGLTSREAEVLTFIASGYTNQQIADRMGVSINSVKSYIRSCYRTIGVDSRSKAVLWGIAHGLHISTAPAPVRSTTTDIPRQRTGPEAPRL